MYVHACMYLCMCAMHVHSVLCIQERMYVCMYVCVYVCMYVFIPLKYEVIQHRRSHSLTYVTVVCVEEFECLVLPSTVVDRPMYVCICMYVCMYVYMYVCEYVCVYLFGFN